VGLAGTVSAVGWLHFGDLRSMHIRSLDQLAATACDAPLINPVETYIADIATALGPPAAVLLLHRLVMWWSRRYRRGR
jgi:hypothetical protein